MREIKFRAWDDTNKKMYYDGFCLRANGSQSDGWIMFESIVFKRGEYDPLNIIVMQFTGLLDKNGKEIFEGDVLTSLYKNDGCKGLYEIVWFGGGFKPRWHGKHQQDGVTINMSDLTRCEIIGNIHSNPELLEDGK